MKFMEAKEKLKVLAAGRYHSIGYNISEYTTGEQGTECYLYIDAGISVTAPTWGAAFALLEVKLGVPGCVEDMPEV